MSLEFASNEHAAADEERPHATIAEDERQNMHAVKMQLQYESGLTSPLNPVKMQEQSSAAPLHSIKYQEQEQQSQQAEIPMAQPFTTATQIDEKYGEPATSALPRSAPGASQTSSSHAQIAGAAGANSGMHQNVPIATEIDFLFSPMNVCDAAALHLVLGLFGALHFRMGRYTMGFIYLFTIGGFGWGWIVDWLRMNQLINDYNSKRGKLSGHESKQTLIWDSYALWIVGLFGANHFYLKRYSWGLFYFFTVGCFGFGWLIDFFRMPLLVQEYLDKKSGDWTTKRKFRYSTTDVYITWCPPAGLFGAHHFYLGDYEKFALYFFTVGLFGVGWIIDFFRVPALVKQANYSIDLKNAASHEVREAAVV